VQSRTKKEKKFLNRSSIHLRSKFHREHFDWANKVIGAEFLLIASSGPFIKMMASFQPFKHFSLSMAYMEKVHLREKIPL